MLREISTADKAQRTRLVHQMAELESNKKDVEKRMKDLKARLMPFISPGLESDGKITIATSKAVLEVTNVSTVVINEDAVDDLRGVLGDRFDDLIEVQVKHKATGALRRLLEDEHELSEATGEHIQRRLSTRFAIRLPA